MDALARYLAARPIPAAIVAGVAAPRGLAAIRSLALAGPPVIALDHRRDAIGFRSRFAFPALGPHPDHERDAFGAFLVELSGQLGRAAPVFPTTDLYLEAFSEAEARLPGRFLLRSPGADGHASDGTLRAAYWGLLGARLDAAPVAGAAARSARPVLDPGPAIARAWRLVRGRSR